MAATKNKTSAISLRIDDDLKAAIDLAAMVDGRSTASLVTKILRDWANANREQAGLKRPLSPVNRGRGQ